MRKKQRLMIYILVKAAFSVGAGILIFILMTIDVSLIFMGLALILYAILVAVTINATHKWYVDD